MTHTRNACLALALIPLAALVLAAKPAQALVSFEGQDPGAGDTDPRPNSNFAAASFDAAASALGPETLITFENAPLGAFTSLSIAPGVTLSDGGSGSLSIRNTPLDPTEDGVQYGYNTTLGGSQFVQSYLPSNGPHAADFTFAAPIQAFGAYFTATQYQYGIEDLNFSDGTSETLTLPGSINGGVAFVGFTDPGKLISSVDIVESDGTDGQNIDQFGIDDVRIVPDASPAPEPSQIGMMALMGLGLGGLMLRARRRQQEA